MIIIIYINFRYTSTIKKYYKDKFFKIKMEDSNNITQEKVKDVLNNVNFSDVIDKLTTNSDDTVNLISQSAEHMTPEMIEQAKKYATGTQGKQIKEEMVRKGIDNKEMKLKMEQQKKLYNEANNKAKGEGKKAIIITSSKIVKSKDIHIKILKTEVPKIIGCENPVELSCSRLAVGPLQGKTIKIWYDPNRKGNNSRASKIVDFKIAGELLIIMEEGDLTENDFKLAEKSLS